MLVKIFFVFKYFIFKILVYEKWKGFFFLKEKNNNREYFFSVFLEEYI